MGQAQIGKEDAATLNAISAVLAEVGRQLDAADRMRRHNPWPAIADQEAAITASAGRLSERFRRSHSGLVQHLLAATNLHLRWGDLRDEIERILLWNDGRDHQPKA